MTTLLAYRMFIDPLPVEMHWLWLIIPVSLAVAIAYKTIEVEHLKSLPWEVVQFTGQILLLMGGAAAIIWVIAR